MTFQTILELVEESRSIANYGSVKGLAILWALYLLLGPLLLFLPIWPLRGAMAQAKREYLLGAKTLYRKVEQEHRAHIKKGTFDSAALEGQTCLISLIEAAGNMSVWPFDRKTLLRFAGVLLSPLVPLVTSQWPKVYHLLCAYLLPGSAAGH